MTFAVDWALTNNNLSIYCVTFLAIIFHISIANVSKNYSTWNIMSRRRHITAITRSRGRCTNCLQNNRYFWSPFLLKLSSLLLGAHRGSGTYLDQCLSVTCKGCCLCHTAWNVVCPQDRLKEREWERQEAPAVHSHFQFPTNTPTIENNLLIITVGINCTDRRTNARLFFSIATSITCVLSVRHWFGRNDLS